MLRVSINTTLPLAKDTTTPLRYFRIPKYSSSHDISLTLACTYSQPLSNQLPVPARSNEVFGSAANFFLSRNLPFPILKPPVPKVQQSRRRRIYPAVGQNCGSNRRSSRQHQSTSPIHDIFSYLLVRDRKETQNPVPWAEVLMSSTPV